MHYFNPGLGCVIFPLRHVSVKAQLLLARTGPVNTKLFGLNAT